MTKLDRREFLLTTLRGSLVFAAGAVVPGPLGRFARADERDASGRCLVVIELAGGNDGLNTLIPLGHDAYRRARPTLAIPAQRALALGDGYGLHPALAGFRDLHEAGQLACVHGVGYPNPDRSHFRSMEIWHTARPDLEAGAPSTGWLGRALDEAVRERDADPGLVGIALQSDVPAALLGDRVTPPAITDPRRFGLPGAKAGAEARALRALLEDTCEGGGDPSDPLALVRKRTKSALSVSDSVHRVADGYVADVPYPTTPLATGLKTVAHALTEGLPTRVFYLGLPGFDTHAGQAGSHERLLRTLGDAVAAFLKDLEAKKSGREVTVMVFSEFGRRVEENASLGTDHGEAGPLFLLGTPVRAGFHGTAPNLDRLHRGDVAYTTDFRRVYQAVIEDVLGGDAATVLGGRFPRLSLFG